MLIWGIQGGSIKGNVRGFDLGFWVAYRKGGGSLRGSFDVILLFTYSEIICYCCTEL